MFTRENKAMDKNHPKGYVPRDIVTLNITECSLIGHQLRRNAGATTKVAHSRTTKIT